MCGAETPDLVQFDIGVLCLRHSGASDPPIGAGQTGGQVGSGTGMPMLSGAAGMRNNLAMRRLPQPDKASLPAEHDGVVPPPDHCLLAAFCASHGYQVTG
jgi:hypothetical protein